MQPIPHPSSSVSPPIPSWGELIKLTIPQLGLMLCHLCISLTDLWVLGHIAPHALAALGLVSQVFMVLLLISSVAGNGCMAVVTQSLGGHKVRRALLYGRLVLILSLGISGVVSVVILLLLCTLPQNILIKPFPFMQPEMWEATRVFIMAYACHLPLFYTAIMMNTLFRAHKLVWLPLCTLVLMMVVNAVGSVGLGLGMWGLPHLGIEGVAGATVASGVMGLLCNMVLALRRPIAASQMPPWAWIRLALPRLWRIGFPATVGQLALQGGIAVLLACVATLPHTVDAVAGMTLGLRLQAILLFPIAALGMSLSICTGHMVGAGHGKACFTLGWQVALSAGAVSAVCALGIYVCHEQLTMLFTTDLRTATEVGVFLLFACVAFPIQVITQLVHAVFAGAGASRLSSTLYCTTMWFMTIPCAVLFSQVLDMGSTGVYMSMAVGQCVSGILSLWQYSRRKWLVPMGGA